MRRPTGLLSLPRDAILRILYLLDVKDILAVEHVSSLHLYQTSTLTVLRRPPAPFVTSSKRGIFGLSSSVL